MRATHNRILLRFVQRAAVHADASQAAVLRVQHDPAVPAHHARRPARLLHPQRLRREGVDDDWRRRCHGDQVREREREGLDGVVQRQQ